MDIQASEYLPSSFKIFVLEIDEILWLVDPSFFLSCQSSISLSLSFPVSSSGYNDFLKWFPVTSPADLFNCYLSIDPVFPSFYQSCNSLSLLQFLDT
jgi:hypothetical protein